MNLENFVSRVSRLFFFGAFVLLAVAVLERAANASGYTVVGGTFTGGRLLEIAAILLIFVIAMQVREMREELRRRSP
jgi:hypothetical protein